MDKREKAYLRGSKSVLNKYFTYILDNAGKIEKKLNKQQEKMAAPPERQVLLDEYNRTRETYRIWNRRLADVEEQILDIRKLLNNKNDYQYKGKTIKRRGYVVDTAKSYLSHNVEQLMNDVRKTANSGIELYKQQVNKERLPNNFQITLEDIIKAGATLKSTPNNPKEDQVIRKNGYQ